MRAPKTLSSEQCEILIDALSAKEGTAKQLYRGFRNKTLAIVMLESGLRVGELCQLRIDDLWFAGQPVDCLVVRRQIAKNKKERQIPVSHRLCEALKVMHSTIWSGISEKNGCYSFFSTDPLKPLTPRTVERIIGDAGIESLNRDVTPHMLRHTFASRLMKKTSSRVVQALLGHESLQSTQIYMHPDLEDLKKAISDPD